MSQSNFEDQKLVAFLRQHKPIAPSPGVDLEQQILAQIERMPLAKPTTAEISQPVKRHKLSKGLWLVPAAIAIGTGMFWANNRQTQFALSEDDRLEIEAALISSWSGAIDRDLDTVIDPYAASGIDELTNGADGYELEDYSDDIFSLE